MLQVDPKDLEYEYQILKAMEKIPIPTPWVYGLDLEGEALGVPCFFSDFIHGEPLLTPFLNGETWAEDLYINTVSDLQAVTETDLGSAAKLVGRETAEDVLEDAYTYLNAISHPLAVAGYTALKQSMPDLPPVKFSNGDLWLENFIIKDQKLAGVIDFANASFSDPIFEFLLSFFASRELQGRGIEERFCFLNGYDPALLNWYHGLEFYDTLRWVLKTGEDFVHHSAASLEKDLQNWLDHY